MYRYRDPPSAREALDKLNGFELAGRAIRVGLGNDKFTNESTQDILNRYNGFRDNSALEAVHHRGTERVGKSGGGGGGASARLSSLDDAENPTVSFQAVSREALMKKLARDEPKEESAYMPCDVELMGRAKKVRTAIETPSASRCILLKNMFNPAEEEGDTWAKELEEDVKTECEGKYGKVHPTPPPLSLPPVCSTPPPYTTYIYKV